MRNPDEQPVMQSRYPKNRFINHWVMHKFIMLKRKNGSKTITASEISQYVYCPISWHLKRSGVKPHSDLLKRGRDEHERAGGRLALLEWREKAARILRLLCYLSLATAVLIAGWILWTYL